MRRFALLIAVLVPVLAFAAKTKVKAKEAFAGGDLEVMIDGELFKTCARHFCRLDIIQTKKGPIGVTIDGEVKKFKGLKDLVIFSFLVDGDGAWSVYAVEDVEEEEGDDDDSAGDDDDSGDAWKEKPVLTAEEWREKGIEKEFPPQAEVIAQGRLEQVDADWKLTIEAKWLPEADFMIGTNGYWGAKLGERWIGSPGKTGVIEFER